MSSYFLVWCLTLILKSAFAEFDPTQHANWNLLDNENCGAPKTARIFGGDVVKLGEFPWMARLVFSGPPTCSEKICGGSILNNKTILTAAHCVKYTKTGCQFSKIVIGDWNKDSDADCENDVCSDPIQTINPKEILQHSAYDDVTLINDIALIKLENEIQYNSYVRPICMVRGTLMLSSFLGNKTMAIGWGIVDNALRENSPKLRKVDLPVVGFEGCQRAFHGTESAKQICVGGEAGKDSCVGDSGGPLMILASENGPLRYYVVGIVSFGTERCGSLDRPSVNTRVTAYAEWILDNLKEGSKNFTMVRLN